MKHNYLSDFADYDGLSSLRRDKAYKPLEKQRLNRNNISLLNAANICQKAIVLAVIILFINCSSLFAQVTEEWVQRFNGDANSGDGAYDMVVDAEGNVYVTGYSSVANGGSYPDDFTTIKYNNSGVLQWVARYNGPENRNDVARAIAIDGHGNVYVTGTSAGLNAGVYSNDFATVKYNASGVQQWVVRYNGPDNKSDQPNSIAVDEIGNVYVTGNSFTNASSPDYTTVKYNASGVQQWVGRYNGPGNSFDEAKVIAVDGGGNVYVTGHSYSSTSDYDYATVKYSASGVQQWVDRYNGTANGDDRATDLVLDGQGNIYVTGKASILSQNTDYATIKYNSSGTRQWVSLYNNIFSSYDEAQAIALDDSGNVYVTGRSYVSNTYNYTTVKYNASGAQQWVASYNGTANGNDEAQALTVDLEENVYVTGRSRGDISDDYATIKYNASGAEQWVARYNGPGNGNDFIVAVALDGSGSVYVSGSSQGGTTTSWDMATVKYSSLTNTSPIAVNDSYSTDEDIILAVAAPGLLTNDTDALQAQLVDSPIQGQLQFNVDGSFSYQPAENFNGSDSFSYKVYDGQVYSEIATVSLTVNAVNDAPVLSNVPANISIEEGIDYTFTATATDVDNTGQSLSLRTASTEAAQTLTFSLAPLAGGEVPAGATIDPSTGVFSWTPGEEQGDNTYAFKVVVSDGIASTEADIPTASVTEVNSAPVLSLATPPASITALMAFSLQASATDADLPQNTLTFSLLEAPAGATIDADGLIHWIPTAEQGNGSSYSFTVAVSDGAASSQDSFSLIVHPSENTAPVLAAIEDKEIGEMQKLRFKAVASDADNDALTFSLVDAPLGAKIDAATGSFIWAPSEKQGPAAYTFKVVVSDGSLTVEEEVNVQVLEINRPPVLGAIGAKETKALAELKFRVIGRDPDFPANTLTYSLEASPTGTYPSGASIDAQTGYFSWIPTAEQTSAIYGVKVLVTDGVLSDEEEIQIHVEGVNAPPQLALIGHKGINELASLSFTATATDADADAVLRYSLIDAPLGAKINASTGYFTWKPTEEQGPAEYTFKVRVSDGVIHDEEEITATVNELNRKPVITAIEPITLDELTALNFMVLATDIDLPANTLSYSLVGKVPAGATIDPQTGAFSWTPDEQQGPATYNIKVRVTDNGTPSLYTDRTFSVTVNEVNTAPVLAVFDAVEIKALMLYSFKAVATDTDLPLNTLSYSLSGNVPSGASIDALTGVFNWTPAADQTGSTYAFDVVVSDGSQSVQQQLRITVNGSNAVPVLAFIGEQIINELRLYTFTATATDADADAVLSYSLINAPLGAKINPETGYFSWKPTEEQGPAVYTFSIRVTDGVLADEEQITVEVQEVNRRPVLAFIENMTVAAMSELRFTASATDLDLPVNTLTYSLVGTVPAGATVDAVTGVFTWTPDQNQAGASYSFKLRVTDNGTPVLYMDRAFSVSVTAGALTAQDSKEMQAAVNQPRTGSETVSVSLSVYPNPTAGDVQINIPGINSQQELVMQVVGLDGRRLMAGSGRLEILNRRLNEQLSSAPAGMYVLELVVGQQVHKVKLMKK